MGDDDLRAAILSVLAESREVRRKLVWQPADPELVVRLESLASELDLLGFRDQGFPNCDLLIHPRPPTRGPTLVTEHVRRVSITESHARRIQNGRHR